MPTAGGVPASYGGHGIATEADAVAGGSDTSASMASPDANRVGPIAADVTPNHRQDGPAAFFVAMGARSRPSGGLNGGLK